jgi:hypothetical protein
VADGKTALTKKDGEALKAAQVEGSQQLKELENIVEQYSQAREQVGDMAILTGKGGDKVMAGIKNMIVRRDKAASEFSPISKAKVGG